MSAGTLSGLTPGLKTTLRLHSPQWAGRKGRGRSPRVQHVFVVAVVVVVVVVVAAAAVVVVELIISYI